MTESDEKTILLAYAQGVMSRSAAMERLGLDWYGALLDRMHEHGIELASLPVDVLATMQDSIDSVFREGHTKLLTFTTSVHLENESLEAVLPDGRRLRHADPKILADMLLAAHVMAENVRMPDWREEERAPSSGQKIALLGRMRYVELQRLRDSNM